MESRYGDVKTVALLKRLSGKTATWRVKSNSRYCRFGGDSKGGLSFFDPEGGPFVSVGSEYPKIGTITKIYHKKIRTKTGLFIESQF